MIVLLGAAGVIVTGMVAVAMILLTPYNLRTPADRPANGPRAAPQDVPERDGLQVGSAP
jgi:hypothetical protein